MFDPLFAIVITSQTKTLHDCDWTVQHSKVVPGKHADDNVHGDDAHDNNVYDGYSVYDGDDDDNGAYSNENLYGACDPLLLNLEQT